MGSPGDSQHLVLEFAAPRIVHFEGRKLGFLGGPVAQQGFWTKPSRARQGEARNMSHQGSNMRHQGCNMSHQRSNITVAVLVTVAVAVAVAVALVGVAVVAAAAQTHAHSHTLRGKMWYNTGVLM